MSPLAQRLSGEPGSKCPIGRLRNTAERRLREAEDLVGQGEYHGGSYLAGYAAEIAVGYCYALCIKADPRADAGVLLGPARHKTNGDQTLKSIFRNGHSPLFWWRLLNIERDRMNDRIPYRSQKRIEPLVIFLHDAWDVWLRYRPDGATKEEAREIIERVRRLLDELDRVY